MNEAKRDWSVAVVFATFAALAVCSALFSRYSSGQAGRALAAQLKSPEFVWEPVREGSLVGRVADGGRTRYLVALPLGGQRVVLSATLRSDATIEDAALLGSGSHASFGRRLVAALNGPGKAAALSYSPTDRSVASVYRALGESLREAHASQGDRR
jgi:hypothetical protein